MKDKIKDMEIQLIKLKDRQGHINSTNINDDVERNKDKVLNACMHAFDYEEEWFLDFGASFYVLSNKTLLEDILDKKVFSIKSC